MTTYFWICYLYTRLANQAWIFEGEWRRTLGGTKVVSVRRITKLMMVIAAGVSLFRWSIRPWEWHVSSPAGVEQLMLEFEAGVSSEEVVD